MTRWTYSAGFESWVAWAEFMAKTNNWPLISILPSFGHTARPFSHIPLLVSEAMQSRSLQWNASRSDMPPFWPVYKISTHDYSFILPLLASWDFNIHHDLTSYVSKTELGSLSFTAIPNSHPGLLNEEEIIFLLAMLFYAVEMLIYILVIDIDN